MPAELKRPRVALVVSEDADVRADWARCFERLGLRTLRCSGPGVLCALLAGDATCPLHDEADLAVYDQSTIAPELTLRLIRPRRTLPIAFAKDRLNAEGRHEPQITSLASEAQERGCFGYVPVR